MILALFKRDFAGAHKNIVYASAAGAARIYTPWKTIRWLEYIKYKVTNSYVLCVCAAALVVGGRARPLVLSLEVPFGGLLSFPTFAACVVHVPRRGNDQLKWHSPRVMRFGDTFLDQHKFVLVTKILRIQFCLIFCPFSSNGGLLIAYLWRLIWKIFKCQQPRLGKN
jgi:hypothetical protein